MRLQHYVYKVEEACRLSRARMMWNYLSRITERGVLMIKNRRIGHIGIATNDVARDVEWYVNVLGFEVTGKFQNGKGMRTKSWTV